MTDSAPPPAPDGPVADDILAAEIARRLGMELPAACVAGVAGNVRLLRHHAAILEGAPR